MARISSKIMEIYAKHITFISAKPFEKTQLDQMYDIYINWPLQPYLRKKYFFHIRIGLAPANN